MLIRITTKFKSAMELLDHEIVYLLFDLRNKSMVVEVRGYPRGEGWGGTVTSTAVSN